MGITLSELVFDPANADEGANVGAYLRADDGTLITHTGAALDVNIASSTGLGIFAEDSAHVSGDLGQQILAVRSDAGGSLVGTDGDYSPLQVDATGRLRVAADLVSSAEYAEDSAHTTGDIGNFMLSVRNDADTSLVGADGDYAPLQVNSLGFLKVIERGSKLEDDAHTTADAGMYMLSVRQDAYASSTSADGDYQSMKSDALGRLYMNRSGQSAAYGATSITTTATDIIGTDLVNRIKVIVQNLGASKCYVGSNASVTSANGIELSNGSSIELEVGAGVNLHAITSSGTADVRYFEVA